MSTVSLTTCFTFHPSSKPAAVELASIKVPENNPPEQSFVTLYGFRDALEELSELRKDADAKGLQFCSVAIDLDVGELPSSLSLDKLKDTRFINLRRVSRELETIVINKFRKYVTEEGGDPLTLETRHYEYLLQRPDLISKLHDEPEFAHIEAFAFPVKSGKSTLQRVAVFSQAHITSINPKTYPEIKATLPNVFKQQKSLSL